MINLFMVILSVITASAGVTTLGLIAFHQKMVAFPRAHKLGLWFSSIGLISYSALNCLILSGMIEVPWEAQIVAFLFDLGYLLILGSVLCAAIKKNR